jgi:hypothetical protein
LQTPLTEVFENNFDSSAVISGWSGATDVYQTVVRPACRNCHVANQVGRTFETKTSFDNFAGVIAADLCLFIMPHALHTVREFWLSTAPERLTSYFYAIGQTSAGNQLAGCGPRSVATLDPPAIHAALANP